MDSAKTPGPGSATSNMMIGESGGHTSHLGARAGAVISLS